MMSFRRYVDIPQIDMIDLNGNIQTQKENVIKFELCIVYGFCLSDLIEYNKNSKGHSYNIPSDQIKYIGIKLEQTRAKLVERQRVGIPF